MSRIMLMLGLKNLFDRVCVVTRYEGRESKPELK